jgi:undecaprenyl-diphosphatase
MTPQLSIVAILLGIIEGLTEFIPISSTGHLIIAENLFKFEQLMGDPDKAELFTVVIQLGAILAVGWYFRKRLQNALFAKISDISQTNAGRLRTHIVVAFMPAAIVGFLFHKQLKLLLTPIPVACALIVGGIVIIIVEAYSKRANRTTTIDTMTMKDALIVGFSQILSLFPGTSRSASTIIPGMMGGMTRPAATEFSFLLSFPIMTAASLFEMFHYRHLLHSDMFAVIGIGFVIAFVVALLIVGWLVRFVQRHTFLGFGVYRVILGALILILYSSTTFFK